MYTYLIPHFNKQLLLYIHLYNLYVGVKNMYVKICVFQQLIQIALTLILSFLF